MALDTLEARELGRLEPGQLDFAINKDRADSVEYVPIKHEGKIKEWERDFTNVGDGYGDSEPDEDFEWLYTLEKKSLRKYKENHLHKNR